MLRLLVLATLWPLVSWGATYDFDYRTVGDADARPANVFDDGTATFFQFAPGRPVPAILKVGPTGEQLATWRPDGPYIVVDGVLPDWRLRLGRGIAAVRYAGSRPLGMKGTLYGAAVPISETGPASLSTPQMPAMAARPVLLPTPVVPAPPAPQQIIKPGAVAERAMPASMPLLPAPVAPAPVLPDFSGSFVVRMDAPGADAPMRRRVEPDALAPALKLAIALPVVRSVIERMSVRFANLIASASDLATLETAAKQAADMSKGGYIVVRAYSGAQNAQSRRRYAALRGEEVKSALVRAGIAVERVRVVTATTRGAPHADIVFIGGGIQV
ncbi:MAG: TrbG/VirB9 family P-type conjugative transfer protein [Gallionellaceae bacterium]|nr:TrbG/VirB9 family P-type conjugative transfer protein [Gallionellaceae bacterium]